MIKKFFYVLLFLLFIIIFFNFNISKASIDVVYNDDIVSLPDIPVDDYITIDMTDNPYILRFDKYWNCFSFWLCTDFSDNSYFYLTNNQYIGFNNSFGTQGTFLVYRLIDNKWQYIESGPFSNIDGDWNSVLYSSFDIYTDVNKTNIIFNASFRFDVNFIEEENFYQITSTNLIRSSRLEFLEATIINESGDSFFLNYEYATLDNSYYIYYYDIYENGTYIINIIDSEKDEEYTFTINCTEIDEDFGSLNLHLSTEEQTTEPIYVLSNRYYYEGDYDISQDFLQNYSIEIAYRLR